MERQVSNRYRLLEPIGEGGMGVVWRAYDELLDRTVAIKEVRYTGVGEAKRAELNGRTIREARAAGRLDHPSVVVIHDVVEEDGRPWIVMQLVRSRSLAQVIRERGPLPVAQAAAIGARVLDALRAAHATGVLHRDVKPENVLLADDGRVVLTDFGIASLEAEAGLTATGGLVGTPAYMPPERLNGEPARPESDLWALGATLYAAVEGRAPFSRDSWAATVAAVLRDEPEPPVRAGALQPVIMGLLRRDPAARMPADEAAHLLHLAASGQHSTVPVPPQPRPGGRSRARWVAVPLALAAAAALVTGGVLLAPSLGDAGGDGPGATGANPPASSHGGAPTATATGAASPTASASPTRTSQTGQALPAGWRSFTSAAGRFTVGLPGGWVAEKTADRDSISFKGPGTPGRLMVEWTVPDIPWDDPLQHWLGLEREIKAKGEFSGYTRLGIRSTGYRGMRAADWEFTRRTPAGRLIHVVNRGFHTADGRPYALYWETLDARWDQDKHYFESFARTFRPL
ncbi:serine/threonine-protein kinase [Nonomuraea pusilla]|uniref:non-specific serine/threonine protein kinase n=1 Tax=Nonomuraea pusilla TaxID=46177 RepID=A0A1H7NRG5_9ACTN|nr:serine/threonine-protein kinase [Nonomuraea pusilla]SEL26180.1 Serine/threonine protein kinase [Nonomuraea pusilla]